MEKLIALFAIRWWAIVGGVVVYFIMGYLWYGPFFGKRWMRAAAVTDEDIQQANTVVPYLIALLASLISTIVLGVIMRAFNPASFLTAFAITGIVWVGFNAAPLMNHLGFDQRPKSLFFYNGGFDLVCWLLITILLKLSL